MNKNVKPQGEVRETEFKGKPVLALYRSDGDKYPLIKFGLAKAGLILAHVEAIKTFHAKGQKQVA